MFGPLKVGNEQARDSLHQAIGGYIPSKELNDLVRNYYWSCGGVTKGNMQFVTKWKDTRKILELKVQGTQQNLINQHTLKENLAKNRVTCKIEYITEIITKPHQQAKKWRYVSHF